MPPRRSGGGDVAATGATGTAVGSAVGGGVASAVTGSAVTGSAAAGSPAAVRDDGSGAGRGSHRVGRRSHGLGWWRGLRGRGRGGLGLACGCFVAHESYLTDRGDSTVIVTPRA